MMGLGDEVEKALATLAFVAGLVLALNILHALVSL
jgi:cell division protein FtsL